MIERYDLEFGIEGLDEESIIGLVTLTAIWKSRTSFRARWMLRAEWERRALR